jgi:hypothetical protein
MKRLICSLIILTLQLYYVSPIFSSESEEVFKTRYTAIHYSDEKDLNDFIWRLGGEKMDVPSNTELASNRIDRLIERVETILDMQPKNFKTDIYLRRGMLEAGRIAFYNHKTKSIYISVDYTSDGVVAHEIAHAVIDYHFSSPLPAKMQEILTQYVDKYLWSDY